MSLMKSDMMKDMMDDFGSDFGKEADFGSDFGKGADFGSDFGKDFFSRDTGRLVPLARKEFNFFDRQRSLFSDMHKGMDDEWKDFDLEIERMKRDMFRLTPLDFKKPETSLLKVERPFVTDLEGAKKLALRFDVSDFKPSEVVVKTMDKVLVVHGKHVEESPGKKITREFSKRYTLPKHIDPLKLTSTLSKDGVLHIEAPAPADVDAPRERLLPIKML